MLHFEHQTIVAKMESLGKVGILDSMGCDVMTHVNEIGGNVFAQPSGEADCFFNGLMGAMRFMPQSVDNK